MTLDDDRLRGRHIDDAGNDACGGANPRRRPLWDGVAARANH